ncbi:MAG: lipoyl domain-containing protein [Vicinamibacterales bacterium]
MASDVLMPQMGESIAEGTIVRWIKKVGDSVDRDEPLFENLDRQGRRGDSVARGRCPHRDSRARRGHGPGQLGRGGHRTSGNTGRCARGTATDTCNTSRYGSITGAGCAGTGHFFRRSRTRDAGRTCAGLGAC